MSELDDILNAADAATGDDEVLLDLSEASDFTPLPQGGGSGPNGFYLVEVTESKAGAGIKTAKGDPAWKLTFSVIDPQADRKAKVSRTLPLRGKGAGFSKDTAAALGIPIDPERPALKPSAYVGRKMWADLELDTRDDPPKWNNVGKMKPYTGAGEIDALVG